MKVVLTDIIATTEVHVNACIPVCFFPVLQKVVTRLQRQEVWVNDGKNGSIVLSSDVQHSNSAQIHKLDCVCQYSPRPATDSTQTAEFTRSQELHTRNWSMPESKQMWEKMHNYFKKKKRISSIKNNVINASCM